MKVFDGINSPFITMKELGEEMEGMAKNVKYFVDFMQDAPEPTGEEEDEGNQETPKVSNLILIQMAKYVSLIFT